MSMYAGVERNATGDCFEVGTMLMSPQKQGVDAFGTGNSWSSKLPFWEYCGEARKTARESGSSAIHSGKRRTPLGADIHNFNSRRRMED